MVHRMLMVPKREEEKKSKSCNIIRYSFGYYFSATTVVKLRLSSQRCRYACPLTLPRNHLINTDRDACCFVNETTGMHKLVLSRF